MTPNIPTILGFSQFSFHKFYTREGRIVSLNFNAYSKPVEPNSSLDQFNTKITRTYSIIIYIQDTIFHIYIDQICFAISLIRIQFFLICACT